MLDVWFTLKMIVCHSVVYNGMGMGGVKGIDEQA